MSSTPTCGTKINNHSPHPALTLADCTNMQADPNHGQEYRWSYGKHGTSAHSAVLLGFHIYSKWGDCVQFLQPKFFSDLSVVQTAVFNTLYYLYFKVTFFVFPLVKMYSNRLFLILFDVPQMFLHPNASY